MPNMSKTLAAASILALCLSAGAAHAQTKPFNIGPTPPPGGGGFNPGGCLAVTLAGSVFVRICSNGYTATGAGTQCSGSAWNSFGGNYSLAQGRCSNGQSFLGGNLACAGPQCNWTPSAAGFAAGFRPETVYAQYQ